MNTRLALAGLVLALLPVTTALAAPAKMAPQSVNTASAKMYECSKCHMKVGASVAKKDHYKDPMDGGKLVPVKPSGSHGKSLGGMKM